MYNHELLDVKGRLIDGVVYLDYETVHDFINDRFYWDANENILRYTTATELVSVAAESSSYTVTRESRSMDHVIVKADAATAYIAIDFVKIYSDFDYEVYENPCRVLLTDDWGDYEVSTVKRDTEIRYRGGIKSPILTDVTKGTTLTVLESDSDWTKVSTTDGIVGYIKSKWLNGTTTETITSDYVPEEFTHISKNFKINMVWHQVTTKDANDTLSSLLQNTKGVNVVSPTWYYLNDNSGNIVSLASTDYVNYCHQNNIEVWALFSNLENTDVDTTAVLTHTSSRDNLVNNLISEAIQYNLDGINIDLESINPNVGDAYIQFIRELSLKCANNGIVLSVDNYVPSSYTAFYNRAEQALFADYVVIMAYDEYYAGCETAGPVASIGFVTDGVTNTLKEVPAEQTILGMPFYTRVWCETPVAEDGNDDASTETAEDTEAASDSYVLYDLTSYATTMSEVQNLLSANGVEPIWWEEYGSYYAEYENNGSTYKMWLENATSLEEKLKVYQENNLAGGAFWKLGLESSDVWDTIIKYIN
jgi:spore germination protein YaaH